MMFVRFSEILGFLFFTWGRQYDMPIFPFKKIKGSVSGTLTNSVHISNGYLDFFLQVHNLFQLSKTLYLSMGALSISFMWVQLPKEN